MQNPTAIDERAVAPRSARDDGDQRGDHAQREHRGEKTKSP